MARDLGDDVYTDRTDLDEMGLALLKTLALLRRANVTADNAQALYEIDQASIADYVARKARGEF